VVVQTQISLATRGRGTYEITATIASLLGESEVSHGLCNVFVQHTSASLIVCENADPGVRRDLETFMAELTPDGDDRFGHVAEGPDDMPAHVRTVLTQTSLTLPVQAGRLALGTWQGVYLWEHRTAAYTRNILVTLYGE